jgi:ATP-dependent DNA ligase
MELWLHEIKDDGFRVIARKSGNRGEALIAGQVMT